jgi:hypothetical protein
VPGRAGLRPRMAGMGPYTGRTRTRVRVGRGEGEGPDMWDPLASERMGEVGEVGHAEGSGPERAAGPRTGGKRGKASGYWAARRRKGRWAGLGRKGKKRKRKKKSGPGLTRKRERKRIAFKCI